MKKERQYDLTCVPRRLHSEGSNRAVQQRHTGETMESTKIWSLRMLMANKKVEESESASALLWFASGLHVGHMQRNLLYPCTTTIQALAELMYAPVLHKQRATTASVRDPNQHSTTSRGLDAVSTSTFRSRAAYLKLERPHTTQRHVVLLPQPVILLAVGEDADPMPTSHAVLPLPRVHRPVRVLAHPVPVWPALLALACPPSHATHPFLSTKRQATPPLFPFPTRSTHPLPPRTDKVVSIAVADLPLAVLGLVSIPLALDHIPRGGGPHAPPVPLPVRPLPLMPLRRRAD